MNPAYVRPERPLASRFSRVWIFKRQMLARVKRNASAPPTRRARRSPPPSRCRYRRRQQRRPRRRRRAPARCASSHGTRSVAAPRAPEVGESRASRARSRDVRALALARSCGASSPCAALKSAESRARASIGRVEPVSERVCRTRALAGALANRGRRRAGHRGKHARGRRRARVKYSVLALCWPSLSLSLSRYARANADGAHAAFSYLGERDDDVTAVSRRVDGVEGGGGPNFTAPCARVDARSTARVSAKPGVKPA